MSGRYVRALRSVRSEYNSARSALQYLEVHWNDAPVIAHIEPLTKLAISDVRNALHSCESVHIIRLFSAYEAMLMEHLVDHHPAITLPSRVSSEWLINRVALLQIPHITINLRQAVHNVREYRNRIVHISRTVPTALTFDDCLGCLAKYLDKLPDPLR